MDKCFPETVGTTICIYGPSMVGKTTLARRLSCDLGVPLRSCGEEVRSYAAALGVAIVALSDEEHRHIDLATRTWAESQTTCIIEGRFLDLVFSGWHVKPMVHILLTASTQARFERARGRAERLGLPVQSDAVSRSDQLDQSFKQRMFPTIIGCLPGLTVDTSIARFEESVSCLQGYIRDWVGGKRPA